MTQIGLRMALALASLAGGKAQLYNLRSEPPGPRDDAQEALAAAKAKRERKQAARLRMIR